MNIKALYSFLNTDLQIIENELEHTLSSEHPVLREASLHLLKAGGKRIRPVFVLLAGKFGQYDIEKMKYVAVALELIHMASLVHDDVIDDAELRRGKQTIKAKWDNRIAMYTGDYIFARAIELMAEIERPEAHRILSETIVEVCIGEIDQIQDKFNFDQTIRVYLRRIKRKTALLIAVSCELGAVASDSSPEVQRLLYWFGYYVGMSFQITDDILDFVATEKQLGKPAGSDLMQGNITLPVLYALENDSFRKDLSTIHEHSSREEFAKIVQLVKHSPSIDEALDLSDRYLQKAFDILKKLPNVEARKSLESLAKFIGKRKF